MPKKITYLTVALALGLAVVFDPSGASGQSAQGSTLRDGAMTLEQVKEWAARSWIAQTSREPPSVTEAPDLNLDGEPDLLVEMPGGGTGGRMYAAFLATAAGYREIGSFQGVIRPVSRTGDGPSHVVISGRCGGGCMSAKLVELTSEGMQLLSRRELAAGDGGTEEGNRLWRALFDGPVAPESAVAEVFGTP